MNIDDRDPVAHFYFDPNKHDTLKTEALLRSYVKQFLRHSYRTQKQLPAQVPITVRRMFGSTTCRIDHTQLLKHLLEPLIQIFERSFLVVDGLDLCSPEEYNIVLDCFSILMRTTPVKIVICGRGELNITTRLPDSKRLEVTRARASGDVASFIKQYIGESDRKHGPITDDADTKALIEETLVREAGHMYVQTKLHFSSFRGIRQEQRYMTDD